MKNASRFETPRATDTNEHRKESCCAGGDCTPKEARDASTRAVSESTEVKAPSTRAQDAFMQAQGQPGRAQASSTEVKAPSTRVPTPSTPGDCGPGSGSDSCCAPSAMAGGGLGIHRRDFLRAVGLASGALLAGGPSLAYGFGRTSASEPGAAGAAPGDGGYVIPHDKGLSQAWFDALRLRGEPEVYTGNQLAYVGMPIGGIATGTVYLGGDGRLWLWDIFNQWKEGVVDITYDDWRGQRVRPRDGANYVFPVSPEYPFEQGFGLRIRRNGRSVERSLDFKGFDTIRFKGQYPVAEVAYEDPTLPVKVDLQAYSPFVPLNVADSGFPATVMRFRLTNKSSEPVQVEMAGWLENASLRFTDAADGQAGAESVRLVNTVSRRGQATLLHCRAEGASPQVQARRDFGDMSLMMLPPVRVDGAGGVSSSGVSGTVSGAADSGERGAGVSGTVSGAADSGVSSAGRAQAGSRLAVNARGATAGVQVDSAVLFPPSQPVDGTARGVATGEERTEAALGEQLCGALSHTITLQPGEQADQVFVVSWFYPNIELPESERTVGSNRGRSYSRRYDDSLQVAADLADRLPELSKRTLQWRDLFYNESTLPHWFLNRTFVNTSILATETCFILEDGRFWGWEGIGCCPGTCTHVWHYAQAMGRLFPELEKNLRERTDFAVMHPETGSIDFRGGLAWRSASDGQAGVVLRAYRDHQMSPDARWLRAHWPSVKLALEYLISQDLEDGVADGMIFGEQHNTLDAEWYGHIPVIISLYLAALAAGVEMARVTGDVAARRRYEAILQKGRTNIEALFNGEYFVQEEDPEHLDKIGVGEGCYIDQVFGQGWAYQLNLGRLYNEQMIRSSLNALWKYNFVPDMGALRDSLPPTVAGRPYAVDGESGLVMCTWPLGGRRDAWEEHWQFGYFNETMTGFEYQAASHMVWEDMLDYGLGVVRAIHDRYDPVKRNPYNEIECSDHYSRAMASYGVYLALCGFRYDGPAGVFGFAPKTGAEEFQAAYTAAEGWGSYRQTRSSNRQTSVVSVASGSLYLTELVLELPQGRAASQVQVMVNGRLVSATASHKNGLASVHLAPVRLHEGDVLEVALDWA